MSYDVTTSDAPTLAPANFASLPPVVEIDRNPRESWHGSGFRPRDMLPRGYGFPFEDEMGACGACKSRDVRCIFFHYFHHMVESDVRVELVCNACGARVHSSVTESSALFVLLTTSTLSFRCSIAPPAGDKPQCRSDKRRREPVAAGLRARAMSRSLLKFEAAAG